MVEFKHFNKLIKRLNGAIKVLVFRIDEKSPEYQSLKKEYKVPKLDLFKP
jgi:hypothetical protein